jgi:hypothetical protein
MDGRTSGLKRKRLRAYDSEALNQCNGRGAILTSRTSARKLSDDRTIYYNPSVTSYL